MDWEKTAIDAPMGIYAVCLYIDAEEQVYKLTPAVLNHLVSLNKTAFMGGTNPPGYFPVAFAASLEACTAIIEDYESLLPALNRQFAEEVANGSEPA